MKLDSNNKDQLLNNSNESLPDASGPQEQNVINTALSDFVDALTSGETPNGSSSNGENASASFPSIIPASGSADDIDPNSDLGSSIQTKYKELEGILNSLKTRLNSVVLEENFEDSPDAQFEMDLDTDCTEDIPLSEFLELLNKQQEKTN